MTKRPFSMLAPNDFHALGQNEGALELMGSDAAMKIGRPVLLTANYQLAIFNADFKFIAGKARDGQNNAQSFVAVILGKKALDVIGWDEKTVIGGKPIKPFATALARGTSSGAPPS